jgi:hypothetical protein
MEGGRARNRLATGLRNERAEAKKDYRTGPRRRTTAVRNVTTAPADRCASTERGGCYGLCQEEGVCLFGQLFIQICSPRASAAASGGALRVSLSSLVNLHSERFLFLAAAEGFFFSYSAYCYPRNSRVLFWGFFSQFEHSCQWKRNEPAQSTYRVFFAGPSRLSELAPFQSLFA